MKSQQRKSSDQRVQDPARHADAGQDHDRGYRTPLLVQVGDLRQLRANYTGNQFDGPGGYFFDGF